MKLKTIIVDDSTMQRMAISKLVSKHPQLNLIAEYSNAIEARNALKNYEIDLIFLDIEMPIINGFDLLEALDNPPQVVLITGKTDYALKAFDYDVTDYLHKPITPTRFDASVRRVVARVQSNTINEENEEHIFVKSNLKKKKVFLNQIKWFEALGDYIKLVTDESNVVILSTMKAFERQLPADKFLRIHKSYIVNLDRIQRFNSKNVEIENHSIPLSRNKKVALTEALTSI